MNARSWTAVRQDRLMGRDLSFHNRWLVGVTYGRCGDQRVGCVRRGRSWYHCCGPRHGTAPRCATPLCLRGSDVRCYDLLPLSTGPVSIADGRRDQQIESKPVSRYSVASSTASRGPSPGSLGSSSDVSSMYRCVKYS